MAPSPRRDQEARRGAMPPKKAKTKKPPPPLPTPRRATVLIAYSYRGLNMTTMGMGGCYRQPRSLILSEFVFGEISVVGNGSTSIADLANSHPLEVRLAETGASLGSLDYAPANAQVAALVKHAVKSVRAYLGTPFALDATTGTLQPPGRFRGSGSFSNLHLPAVKGKKKGKKKK